jgi:hypothetical protein
VGAIWLLAALVMCLISLKRWTLALAATSVPLLAFSLISFVGIFTLAPAAFWFGCALWLWSRDSGIRIVLSALATVGLVTIGTTGVLALFYLAAAPV